VRDLTLEPSELGRFSVPIPLCLAGECQYALGLGTLVAAVHPRVLAEVEETAEDFQLLLRPPDRAPNPLVDQLLGQWREALASVGVADPDDLDGLRITLDFSEARRCSPPEFLLGGPAVAVALACAVMAHRGVGEALRGSDVIRLAGDLLAGLAPGRSTHPDRFYGPCCVTVCGGAMFVAPSSEPLNVQLLLPPDALILVVPPARGPDADAEGWEQHLLSGLRKVGGAARLAAAAGQDASGLFELAAGRLDDREAGVLYGLLRVSEMIRAHLEGLAEPSVDHDRLAELCDEESAILQDYFGFLPGRLVEVRDRAVEFGALGAKLTWGFGRWPAVIVLAPGRRPEVRSALAATFRDHHVASVDVDPAGVRTEP